MGGNISTPWSKNVSIANFTPSRSISPVSSYPAPPQTPSTGYNNQTFYTSINNPINNGQGITVAMYCDPRTQTVVCNDAVSKKYSYTLNNSVGVLLCATPVSQSLKTYFYFPTTTTNPTVDSNTYYLDSIVMTNAPGTINNTVIFTATYSSYIAGNPTSQTTITTTNSELISLKDNSFYAQNGIQVPNLTPQNTTFPMMPFPTTQFIGFQFGIIMSGLYMKNEYTSLNPGTLYDELQVWYDKPNSPAIILGDWKQDATATGLINNKQVMCSHNDYSGAQIANQFQLNGICTTVYPFHQTSLLSSSIVTNTSTLSTYFPAFSQNGPLIYLEMGGYDVITSNTVYATLTPTLGANNPSSSFPLVVVKDLLTSGLTQLIQNEPGYAGWSTTNIQAFVAFLLTYESFMVKAMRLCANALLQGAQQVLFPANIVSALEQYFIANPFQGSQPEILDLAHFLCKARYLQAANISSDTVTLPSAASMATFAGSEQADYFVAKKITDAFMTQTDPDAVAYIVFSSKTLAHQSLIDFDLPFLSSIQG